METIRIDADRELTKINAYYAIKQISTGEYVSSPALLYGLVTTDIPHGYGRIEVLEYAISMCEYVKNKLESNDFRVVRIVEFEDSLPEQEIWRRYAPSNDD